jgi:hypothetical protein
VLPNYDASFSIFFRFYRHRPYLPDRDSGTSADPCEQRQFHDVSDRPYRDAEGRLVSGTDRL